MDAEGNLTEAEQVLYSEVVRADLKMQWKAAVESRDWETANGLLSAINSLG